MVLAAALVMSICLPQKLGATYLEAVPAISKSGELYAEIKVTELPDAVSKAILKDYWGCTIDQAFSVSDGTYKVEIHKSQTEIFCSLLNNSINHVIFSRVVFPNSIHSSSEIGFFSVASIFNNCAII